MSLKTTFRPTLSRVRAWLHRSRISLFAASLGFWEKWSQPILLPPPLLRYRVHGALDVASWLRVSERCTADLAASLAQLGVDFQQPIAVLDFGCGCGRVLVPLRRVMPAARLFGVDIDAEAVGWCRAHIPSASVQVNGSHPPLPFPDDSFDVIYAISVFTHLNEEMQTLWLRELARVLRPRGVVALTVHGGGNTIDSAGSLNWKGHFPDWYQDTLHSERYVRETFGKYFEVVRYVPRGMNAHQDLIELRHLKAQEQESAN